MAEMLDLPSWRLGTADLIQQMAMLVYMNKHDDDTSIYKMVTSARVGYELYHRISNEDRLEQYQAECILGIVEYIKANPKASQTELVKEIERRIELFAAKVDNL